MLDLSSNLVMSLCGCGKLNLCEIGFEYLYY